METVPDMMSELEVLIGEQLDWDLDPISSRHVVINTTDLGKIIETIRKFRDGYTSFRLAPMKGGE